MVSLNAYPRRYRKNINKLMYMLCADAETVFSMMKMTALLMDLDLDDDRVACAILMDCGVDFAHTEDIA